MAIALKTEGFTSWETPAWVLQELESFFGPFDLDAAATEENKKAPVFFSESDDALSLPWNIRHPKKTTVFLNPPYGRDVGQWVKKAYEEAHFRDCLVAVLIRSATDTEWWHEYAMKANEIFFVKGRIKFIGPHTNSPPFASAVLIFRKKRFPHLIPFPKIISLERRRDDT